MYDFDSIFLFLVNIILESKSNLITTLFEYFRCDNIAATKTANHDHIALYYGSKKEKDILKDKVELLKKFVKIDTYGKHGEFKNCNDNLNICLQNITANYKFFLSLENWFCEDYVSKKFYRSLQ